MAKPVTIAQLEADIRWQADQERALLRHTSSSLRRVMNQSISRYREMVSENGDPYYLTHHTGRLTPGVAASEGMTEDMEFSWGKVDLRPIQPTPVRIYGFDVHVGEARPMELDAIGFNQRNDFSDEWQTTGRPLAFFGYNEHTLGVVPAPDSPYKYTLWYLPELPDLMSDEDEFNPCVPGGEQWVVWDVMHKIYLRDDYPSLVGPVLAERDRVWLDILNRISTHTRVGSSHRLDTRGKRSRNAARFYWFFGG